MRIGRIMTGITVICLAGCGDTQQEGAPSQTGANANVPGPSQALLAHPSYQVSLTISSDAYEPHDIGGFVTEIEVPAGIVPDVAPGEQGKNIYELTTPVAVNPECASSQTVTAGAWLPQSHTIRLAIVSANSMQHFGNCISIRLPVDSNATISPATHASVTSVVLNRKGIVSSGDPQKLFITQNSGLQ